MKRKILRKTEDMDMMEVFKQEVKEITRENEPDKTGSIQRE